MSTIPLIEIIKIYKEILHGQLVEIIVYSEKSHYLTKEDEIRNTRKIPNKFREQQEKNVYNMITNEKALWRLINDREQKEKS